MKKNKKNISTLQPRSLVLIFSTLAILILVSLVVEYYQRNNDFDRLMQSQTHALLETATISLKNALVTGREVDNQLSQRLLNNATFIKILLEENKITNTLLKRIAKENNIYRINIFNNNGDKVYTSFESPEYQHLNQNPPEELYPIFEDYTDTLILGIKETKIGNSYRYIAALATKDNGAIVLVLDAEEILDFRNKLGMGVLLKKLTHEPKIIYAVLQDSLGFIAASGKFTDLEDIGDSEFLSNAIKDNVYNKRIMETDSIQVFEAVQPFIDNGHILGLLRIGISLDALKNITERFITRLVISGAVLILLGFVVISLLFASQNIKILEKQYNVIETYSKNILFNVNDAIIVLDNNLNIKTVNQQGNIVFKGHELLGKSIFSIVNDEEFKNLFEGNLNKIQIYPNLNGERKIFVVSKSSFADENNDTNFILVFNDLTDQKLLEDKIERQKRLSAMGELAGGVAHEIRNPLNTIGTIAQQLNKDFEPIENKEEFFSLTKLVYQEVKRINQTIIDFLKFAKPEPINLSEFLLSDLINQIAEQYRSYFREKNIEFVINNNWDGQVNWDKNKILQSIMNLLQNAYDAVEEKGNVKLEINKKEKMINISITDNGKGISKESLSKIFNLYYTTKAKGTGLGLSITQRIIYEHNGLISVDSNLNVGTVFTVSLPINPNNNKVNNE